MHSEFWWAIDHSDPDSKGHPEPVRVVRSSKGDYAELTGVENGVWLTHVTLISRIEPPEIESGKRDAFQKKN